MIRRCSTSLVASALCLCTCAIADPLPALYVALTINPEARVSALLVGVASKPANCRDPIELPIQVQNRGFATFRLLAYLPDAIPTSVALDLPPEPLTGATAEHRILRITLTEARTIDLTIAFRVPGDKPDLGGRDRIHLLIRCAR